MPRARCFSHVCTSALWFWPHQTPRGRYPISQMRKQRHRKVKRLVQGSTAGRWQGQDSDPDWWRGASTWVRNKVCKAWGVWAGRERHPHPPGRLHLRTGFPWVEVHISCISSGSLCHRLGSRLLVRDVWNDTLPIPSVLLGSWLSWNFLVFFLGVAH